MYYRHLNRTSPLPPPLFSYTRTVICGLRLSVCLSFFGARGTAAAVEAVVDMFILVQSFQTRFKTSSQVSF